MNLAELNAILYYADFLSLKTVSHPVTDNCKYYFVHGVPMNSAYIIDLQPCYNENDPFFQQATSEYHILKHKFGDEGVMTFIEEIAVLKQRGAVNAKQMLRCIHQYSSKTERRQAFVNYYQWLDNQKYYHTTADEEGNKHEVECSRYIYHAERNNK